ncbi:S-adenosyl-L-methionine-dependent methyltransferase [Multifurca ochricompacta]|uniref:S-adenosyl-L-methionine-dependent methyltransferase n=1 Tax=Multifurca ochricompacta TaxID=376703 RepID=A0AAD4M3A1_9AGAM|nr:S-adenosyl-L-methionine-dependent methyltransferase [Multifurca ochricompacta]
MIYHLPSCLRFFEASHIPELLSAAGPAGLSVIEISASVGVDSVKISHILRLLATHHIIQECEPDIFALNRVSALLDSGRSFTECQSAPEKKYDAECAGVAALAALNTDELFKASAYFTDALLPSRETIPKRVALTGLFTRSNSTEPSVSVTPTPTSSTPTLLPPVSLAPGPVSPATQSLSRSPLARAQPVIRRLLSRSQLSGAVDDRLFPVSPPRVPTPDTGPVLAPTAFNLSQRTALPYWTWLETPENGTRLARFARAMAGTEGWMGASDAELCAFPFPELAEGALVVDVGGGIGSTTLRLAERFPNLRFIVQDREPVCRLGEDAWKIHSPGLIKSRRVCFQVHDFFKPQPMHDDGIKPAVFLLRVVCHDWPDTLARRILLQLRRAADEGAPNKKPTYLVIGDHLLPYACAGTKVSELKVDGGAEALQGAHWPLLANLGAASANAYWMDMTMQVIFGGQERTLPELRLLAQSAGWRLIRVARVEGSLFAHVVAEPGPLPSASALKIPTPSVAGLMTVGVEEEIPPAMVERGATPVMDMLGAARTLLRAGTGGKRGNSGERVWGWWMQRKAYADENDARRGPTGLVAEKEKSATTASPGGQGRGLLKKVSQYFGEGG